MNAMATLLFYLCPRCFEPAEDPTPCPRCGGERVACRPGAPDDPVRKPLMTATGEIKSRAPLWWLRAAASPDNGYGNQLAIS
jgi:hypothetical protein